MLVPKRNPLRRLYGGGDLHFMTTSCYRRKPFLGTAKSRDIFLEVLEQIRRRYQFDVIGFVVMPEHVHLLIGEPERDNPSLVMQVLKQTVARRLLRRRRKRHTRQQELWNYSDVPERVWQRRFYDFNVFSDAKITEKLRYMHRNPVKRGLVSAPELWAWSSYRVYAFGERGRVNMDWRLPPYTFRTPKGIKSQDNASIPTAHPSKTANSAAPTSRSHKRKST